QAGIIFAETFQWRHHPQGQTSRDLVRAGRIGTLRLIEAGFSFMLDHPEDVRWDPAMGGGALYDVGCYPISLTRYITGQEPIAVTAQAHWGQTGVDDSVVATLEFPGDVLAVINCGFILPLRRYFEITGTEGSLHVNHAYNPKDDVAAEILRYGSDRELVETIPVGKHDSYTLMIEDFHDVVLDGREQPFPPEDAVRNMRVIDAIYAAAREGRRVTV
ncbi:MAG: gfo/Idh/MocA family oxidoreductase, partial [Chloroflexi bacterium]